MHGMYDISTYYLQKFNDHFADIVKKYRFHKNMIIDTIYLVFNYELDI